MDLCYLDWIELDWIGLDWMGLNWTGLDRIGRIVSDDMGYFSLETCSSIWRGILATTYGSRFHSISTRASLVIIFRSRIFSSRASERKSERVEGRVFSLVIYGMDWIAKSRNVIYLH